MEHLTHSAAETEALGCRLGCALAPGTVIATGGGMVLTEENRRFMRENVIVLYLSAPAEVLASRLQANPNAAQRPTLTGKSIA